MLTARENTRADLHTCYQEFFLQIQIDSDIAILNHQIDLLVHENLKSCLNHISVIKFLWLVRLLSHHKQSASETNFHRLPRSE